MWLKFVLLAVIPLMTWVLVFQTVDLPARTSTHDTYRQLTALSLKVEGLMNKIASANRSLRDSH